MKQCREKPKFQFSIPVQVNLCIVNFRPSQESLCGTRDLSHVTSLEICVDTQEHTLGNFGKSIKAFTNVNYGT